MAKVNWQYTNGTVSNITNVGFYGKGNVYAITFTYKVDGHYYSGEFNSVAGHSYSEDGNIKVGYNPGNPEQNNLNGRDGWMRWMPLIYAAICAAAFTAFLISRIRGCHK